MSVLNSFYTNSILVPLFCIPTMDGSLFISNLNTGGLSSSCEMIILRNNGHGGIIRVCIGIFTSALRNKKIHQILKKKYLTSLPQRIACYLTAYFDEKSPFERVVHFEVFNVQKKSFSYTFFLRIGRIFLFLRALVNIPIQTIIIPP